MTAQNQTIHLAIAFDQNFIDPVYVLLSSILTANESRILLIHAIATGVSMEVKQAISSYVKAKNAEIIFYDFNSTAVTNFPANLSHVTLAAYYRLFIPLLIEENIETLLYIDTDVVVLADLYDLYTTNLGSFPLGAVPDNAVPTRSELGIPGIGNYFNSGVLLISVPEWKKQRVMERAIEALSAQPELMRFVDQDALNAVLVNNWLKLDMKYNVTLADVPFIPNKQLPNYLRNKVIIHFTTTDKPWKKICTNRFKFVYHNALQKLPHLSQKKQGFAFTRRNITTYVKLKLTDIYFDFPLLMKIRRSIG